MKTIIEHNLQLSREASGPKRGKKVIIKGCRLLVNNIMR